MKNGRARSLQERRTTCKGALIAARRVMRYQIHLVGWGASSADPESERRSYHETVMGDSACSHANQEKEDEDGDTSDVDEILEGDKVTWFGMGMTKEEKKAARRLWRSNLIIKLVRRSIEYQYLWRRIQATWRMQSEPTSIDLSSNFFIVKLQNREKYERALFDGPWMIGDHYLHVQK